MCFHLASTRWMIEKNIKISTRQLSYREKKTTEFGRLLLPFIHLFGIYKDAPSQHVIAPEREGNQLGGGKKLQKNKEEIKRLGDYFHQPVTQSVTSICLL